MLAQPFGARMDPTGDQVVEITVDHRYRPESIVARAEVPLRLIFHRKDDEPCSERVVFSSPHIDRRLAPHGDTTIVLPPQPPGEVRFTCALGRYRGQIELRRDARPSLMERFRVGRSRLANPVGTAVVLWLLSLPLVALLVGLILYPAAAVLATLFALIAWIAGCLWAFGGLRHPA